MDDSSLVDIYEDLSVDKWTKSVIEEGNNGIDLFTEALAVDTIDKVQHQLSGLKKENEKLRQENAQLIESRKQLSKNISSLFLTARLEIQKKEQEIAKLLLDRQRENCEPCVALHNKPVETLRSQTLVSKQPADTHLSSVSSKSPAHSKKEHASEINGRMTVSASESSYSRSSCHGLVSRTQHEGAHCIRQTVHNRNNNTVTSERQHLFSEEKKLQRVTAGKDRVIIDNRRDGYCKRHHNLSSKPSHGQSHDESTLSKIAASKECKSVAQKNKMPQVPDHQECVKIRKIETAHASLLRNSGLKKSDVVDNIEQMESFSETDISDCKNKSQSFDLEPSTLSNSKLAIRGHPESESKLVMRGHPETESKLVMGGHPEMESKLAMRGHPETESKLAMRGHPETKSKLVMRGHPDTESKLAMRGHPEGSKKLFSPEPGKKVGSNNNFNLNYQKNMIGWKTFENSTCEASTPDTLRSQSAQNIQHNRQSTKITGNVQLLNQSMTNKSSSDMGSVNCVDIRTVIVEELNENGHGKTEMGMNNVQLVCIPAPCKIASSAKARETGSDVIRNVKSVSHLRESPSEITTADKLFSGENCKEHAQLRSTSEEFNTFCGKANASSDSDKNSNFNNCVSQSYQQKPAILNDQFECRSDQCEAVDDEMHHITYITCTSNLILLGDEETTATTIASPSKLQPSEFYPPGVRGDVHEGGSHVRHIRGLTEVIKKVPTDNMNYSFQNQQDNSSQPNNVIEDRQIQTKAFGVVNLTNTPIITFSTDNVHKTSLKSQRSQVFEKHKISSVKELISSTCIAPEEKFLSQTCNHLKSDTEYNNESSEERAYSTGREDWGSAVNEMFGDVFQNKLDAWKQEVKYPTKSEVEIMKEQRSYQDLERKATVSQKFASKMSTSLITEDNVTSSTRRKII